MAERIGKLPTTPIRYAYVAPDGTIPYFEASDGRQVGGRLPAGADPMQLKKHGYEFVSRDIFTQTQRATDPQYRAEQDGVDDLAEAFDMNMGAPNDNEDTLQKLLDMRSAAPQSAGSTTITKEYTKMMDPNSGLDPAMMEVLQKYANEGRMDELFQPFQQQQQLIQQASQRGRHSSPTGAMLGGLSRAIGTGGQAFLNSKMQGDASGRLGALMEMMQKQKGIDSKTGLMAPAVDDATLASIFSMG